ncbi:hypothetical protein N7U66_04740 [Lacinutrix neustonica]|uniref:Uncharacterized protein n=1 Tax=Lacinutrix neustonica TaxID=2980107 RepID=A0A9E8MZ64_9FLAO|nr:hypothetical protein [Lacinutrix neustonica]WAC02939.1 hypothetical protein N7U66_04740 [Lacinutrix neustonica]
MLKPNHITYLRLADSVINNLNLPYKSYTSSDKELFQSINSDVPYERIYSNDLEKFFLEDFDASKEVEGKQSLFNSILYFLRNEDLIHINKNNITLSYKGILKNLYGFEYDYIKEKQEAEEAGQQRKFENKIRIFKTVWPVITFVSGLIITYFFTK